METQGLKSTEALQDGVVLGAYKIAKTIGRGGFGITYLATQEPGGARVVVKENLPLQFCYRNPATSTVETRPSCEADYEWALTRFVDEAQLLSSLSHPHIVRVLHAFKALGTAYYVMPFVGGCSADKYAWPHGEQRYRGVRTMLEELLDALQYLHGHNLLHRDIKPGNILMDEGGHPVLIDFGAARSTVGDLTQTRMESPGYTPFEQLQSKGNTGPWTDLYALGATCYKIITGQAPPTSVDRMGSPSFYIPLVTLAGQHPGFPLQFLQTVDKAMALMVEDRWQSAAEWLAALRAVPEPAAVVSVQDIRLQAAPQMPIPSMGVEAVEAVEEVEYADSGVEEVDWSAPPAPPVPQPVTSASRRALQVEEVNTAVERPPAPTRAARGATPPRLKKRVRPAAAGQGAAPAPAPAGRRRKSMLDTILRGLFWLFAAAAAVLVALYFIGKNAPVQDDSDDLVKQAGQVELVDGDDEKEAPAANEPGSLYARAKAALAGGDTDAGMALLRQAADAGSGDACCELGHCYYEGRYGTRMDRREAVRYYCRARKSGCCGACTVLDNITTKYLSI